jgi:DNA polymerase III subunit alpha
MVSTVLATDTVVKIKGKVKVEDEVVSLNASELSLPDITQGASGPVVISLPATRCTPQLVQQLRDVLAAHPGLTEVRLRLRSADKTTVMKLDERLRVTPSPPLMADLKALLGPSCLTL